MSFEELKDTLEHEGYEVQIFNTSPRCLRASKIAVEIEFNEKEWNELSEDEQIEIVQEEIYETNNMFK